MYANLLSIRPLTYEPYPTQTCVDITHRTRISQGKGHDMVFCVVICCPIETQFNKSNHSKTSHCDGTIKRQKLTICFVKEGSKKEQKTSRLTTERYASWCPSAVGRAKSSRRTEKLKAGFAFISRNCSGSYIVRREGYNGVRRRPRIPATSDCKKKTQMI